MENCSKRPCFGTAARLPESGGRAMPQDGFPLPDTIIHGEIFPRLEVESLGTLACVCRTLSNVVSQALPSLELSAFSPNGEVLHYIARLRGVKSVTMDCLHLDECSIVSILGPHLQELKLLKCVLVSSRVVAAIVKKCPNLRILVLELAEKSSLAYFGKNLIEMLPEVPYLKHLSMEVRGIGYIDLAGIDRFLPQTLKYLKLQPVNEQGAISFMEKLRDEKEIPSINSHLSGFTLLRLSLVLHAISDRLIASITSSLPLLVELDLEDRPYTELWERYDLTNNGLQFLGSSKHLTHLSIVRHGQGIPVSFERINDSGILLLAEHCGGLESVKLGGFSKVTDAGFSSLLRSCHHLKKFEIRHAPLLSDIAFHDIVCPLVELKLISCNLLTSEAVAKLASSSTLELLDTNSCRSIADTCLDCISHLSTLTSLNLGGTDITDRGLAVLRKGDLPLTSLCLRGCVRVTDRGIICLLNGNARIKKTLSSLDIGHNPGMSDRAIQAIISNAEAITELRMRYCFHVTDASFQMLASGRNGGSIFLHKLDIFHCVRFSAGLVELLQMPLFRGLRWLGVGETCLAKRDEFSLICRTRPWLTVCFEGCEVGCHDAWQFHKYNGGN